MNRLAMRIGATTSTAAMLAALLLAPAALAVQEKPVSDAWRRHEENIRRYRTWTADSVLVALATREGNDVAEARAAAGAILRGSALRPWQRLDGVASPLSQAERDAFAERLVAIAIANPESPGAKEIVSVIWGEDDFDAVLQMYEAGVDSAWLWHLVQIDPRRAIEEVGMAKLRVNRWRDTPERVRLADRARLGDAYRALVPGFHEMCRFIGQLALPFGTLAALDGQPVFTFHEGVDLSPMSNGREPTMEEYDALDDATNELYEAGIIDSPCPHPGMPAGTNLYTKHQPPTRPGGR